MSRRSKLLKIFVKNLGCIGEEGVAVELDDVVCLVGKNNSGKSTILRAYELAHTPSRFNIERDRCRWAADGVSSVVELDVHIPEGTGNVAERWKVLTGDLLVVRSRWEWNASGDAQRKTWDPELKAWAEDGKAGGLETVFKCLSCGSC
ncbi:AAA family ATPase [Geminicoccus sp.]|uniref:AAA family ATPase n=1 Tax=Geminicoccus sp. TaxID=2024832 RepID=UPI0032C2322D